MTDSLKVITVRITHEQYEALRLEATQRAIRQGGKADASAIVRELLDRWLEERRTNKRQR